MLFTKFNPNILEQLGKALAQMGKAREPTEVWYWMGLALRNAGLYREAVVALEHCIEEDGSSPFAFRAALHLARIAMLQGNWERALSLMEWARPRATDDRDRLNLANVWAGILAHRGEVKKGRTLLLQSLEELRQKHATFARENPDVWSYALNSVAGVMILQGHLREAQEYLKHASQSLQNVRDDLVRSRGEILLSLNLSEIYRQRGEFQAARRVLEEALQKAQEHHFENLLHDLYLNLAHVLVDEGKDLEKAEELLAETRNFYESQSASLLDLVEVDHVEAKLLGLRGDAEGAQALAQRALERAETAGALDKVAAVAETLYRWTGNASYLRQAIEAYRRIGNEERAQALQKA